MVLKNPRPRDGRGGRVVDPRRGPEGEDSVFGYRSGGLILKTIGYGIRWGRETRGHPKVGRSGLDGPCAVRERRHDEPRPPHRPGRNARLVATGAGSLSSPRRVGPSRRRPERSASPPTEPDAELRLLSGEDERIEASDVRERGRSHHRETAAGRRPRWSSHPVDHLVRQAGRRRGASKCTSYRVPSPAAKLNRVNLCFGPGTHHSRGGTPRVT